MTENDMLYGRLKQWKVLQHKYNRFIFKKNTYRTTIGRPSIEVHNNIDA